MANASIPTAAAPTTEHQMAGNLYHEIGRTPVTLTGSDPQVMLADAYLWRGQVRGVHTLVQAVLRDASQHDLLTIRALIDALGAASLLSELAEAVLQQAFDCLEIDYTCEMS